MAINSESLDLRGLTIQCDALEVNGTEVDTTDLGNIADLVGDLTATAEEINAAAALVADVTATAAEINLLDGLATVDPADGVTIWNDGGVLKVASPA
jgi:hypothetical protein